jgi:uncharacterized protein YunC (DUF1805 family)
MGRFAEYISAPIHPGHKVWKLDLTTKQIIEEKNTIDQLGNGTIVTVRQQKGFLYCTALSVVNADKEFIKMLGLTDKIKYAKSK